MADDRARIGTETAMDTINRVLSEVGDDAELITICVMKKDSDEMFLYSNARSDPEMFGMLYSGLNWSQEAHD